MLHAVFDGHEGFLGVVGEELLVDGILDLFHLELVGLGELGEQFGTFTMGAEISTVDFIAVDELVESFAEEDLVGVEDGACMG